MQVKLILALTAMAAAYKLPKVTKELALPAGCHQNPNPSLSTFHIRKYFLIIQSHVEIACDIKRQ